MTTSGQIQPVPLSSLSGRHQALGYAINGIPLATQPYLATAPTPSGSLIETGTRFILFFNNPDTLTRTLLTNGAVCTLQFLLTDGRAPEATVLFVSSWNSPLLLVEVQVLSTTDISASQLPFMHTRQDGFSMTDAIFGDIPIDSKDKPVLGLYDPVTHSAIAAQAGATVIDSSNNVTYGPLQLSFVVGAALTPYVSNPAQTAAAGADTQYKFGSAGATTFNHVSIQNNTSASIFYAFDQSTTVSGNAVYTLTAGNGIFWDRIGTVLHFSSAAQQNFGGQSGITVEAFT